MASLLLHVDDGAEVPLHRQIFDGIRNRILAGEVAAGVRLPSSRQLAIELGVARSTVLQALDALIAEGFLVSRAASSVCVAPELPVAREFAAVRRVAATGRMPRLSAVARLLLATPTGAPRLGAAPRAFRPGIPALDLFPAALWARIAARTHARAGFALLEGGDPAGHRDFRAAVAAHVSAARGVRCTSEQVFVTAGTQPALEEILRLVLDPGAAAWIENPGYLGTRRAVLTARGRAIPIRVDAEGLDVGEGVRRAPDARIALVAPSHQYPLGVTMSLARRMALLAWAARARAVVVEDDYDCEFRHRGRPLTALQGLDEAGCVIYVGTFSKTMFPGLRIGFLVAPPALLKVFAAARADGFAPASALEQEALAAFIEEGHFATHLRRMRVAYRERSAALLAALQSDCGGVLTPRSGDAGMQLTAELDPAISDRAVRAAAAQRGVEVAALSEYCLGAERRNGLVFGFGCVRPAEMRAGTRLLAEAIAAVRRR